MSNIDFVSLAKQCQETIKGKTTIPECGKYDKTFFISISDNNIVTHSIDPEILKNAKRCILIHRSEEKTYKKWYSRYYFQMIDENGCIHEEEIDDNFSMDIQQPTSSQDTKLSLYKDDTIIYSCYPPYEKEIAKFWKVYLKARECTTLKEAELLCQLIEKDNEILELQRENDGLQYARALVTMERDQYKTLLEEIRQLVSERK